MGANLVPIVRNFRVTTEDADQHSIDDGCLTPGSHRLLRFDFLTHNIGEADLVVGNPGDHPEWFVESHSHGHFHLKDFNKFTLRDGHGVEVAGAKQAFCLMDSEHPSPWGPKTPKYTCAFQGVQAGWADLYYSGLPCQFVVIDGLSDGDYVLTSTTNALQLLPEDTFGDNTIHTRLRIIGGTVVELAPVPRLHDFAEVVRIIFGVANDGGGIVIGPNGVPIPIDPWGPLFEGKAVPTRDLVAGLAIEQLASLVSDPTVGDSLRRISHRLASHGAEMLARR